MSRLTICQQIQQKKPLTSLTLLDWNVIYTLVDAPLCRAHTFQYRQTNNSHAKHPIIYMRFKFTNTADTHT